MLEKNYVIQEPDVPELEENISPQESFDHAALGKLLSPQKMYV